MCVFYLMYFAEVLITQVVKEKYGSDAEENDEEDSEEAESEDEEGEELTPAVDAAILRTLAKIKRKDPDIYALEKSIFKGILQSTWYANRFSSNYRGAEAYNYEVLFPNQ